MFAVIRSLFRRRFKLEEESVGGEMKPSSTVEWRFKALLAYEARLKSSAPCRALKHVLIDFPTPFSPGAAKFYRRRSLCGRGRGVFAKMCVWLRGLSTCECVRKSSNDYRRKLDNFFSCRRHYNQSWRIFVESLRSIFFLLFQLSRVGEDASAFELSGESP